MSACPVEITPSSQWPSLEPEGRGHELLIAWGLHRRGGEQTRSPIASLQYDREPIDPVYEDEPDFVVLIDDVLRVLMRSGHEDAVAIVKRFYLEHPKYDYFEVAGKVHRTEGFVRLTLRGVAALVESKIPE
jgi:hypothetical protein